MMKKKLTENISVETVYPGVNVGCIITDQGTLCIDTPLLPAEAQRWWARISSLGGEPVRCVVYTNGQRERILGTQHLIRPCQDFHVSAHLGSPSGEADGLGEPTVIAHKLAWAQVQAQATDNAKQSVVDMLAERDSDIIKLDIVLPQVTLDESLKLYLGREEVIVFAAAPGVLWVWFPEHGVLFAGDTVVVGTHPPLLVTDTREWLLALARLRRERRFQEAVIVPGRGPLCDVSVTEPLTEYLRRARDRTRWICRAGRPKADLNKVAADLLPLYPVVNGQHERTQRQIKLGLDELYDQFKSDDTQDTDID